MGGPATDRKSHLLLTDSGVRPWREFVLCGKTFGTAVDQENIERLQGEKLLVVTILTILYSGSCVIDASGWWWIMVGNKIKVRA